MRYLLAIFSAWGLTGCVDQAPLQGHSCPCVSGWKCCANNSCVPENAACGVSPDQDNHRAVTGTRTLCGYDEDWNEDGVIDATHDVRVDSSGLWQHDEGRRTSDGQLYDVWDFTVDDNTGAQHYADAFYGQTGSTADHFDERWTYDAMNRLVSQELSDDGGGDPTLAFHERTSWTYGAADTAITTREDQQPDGTWAQSGTCTYALLPDGHIDHYACDDNLDGTTDRTVTYSYTTDAMGNHVKTWEQRDASGTLGWRRILTWSGANNQLLSFEHFRVQQGSMNLSFYLGWYETYDGDGNEISWETVYASGQRDRSTDRYCGN